MNPTEFKYSEEHEWVNAENNEAVIVGITNFAAGTLGDVVFVELPDIGTEIKQFAKFGEIWRSPTLSHSKRRVF